ncbi:MAG: HAD family hydrolase [Micrococcaceae bacterium]
MTTRNGIEEASSPRPWRQLQQNETALAAVRLVACDMDGTLLDARGRIPSAFWETARRLRDRGITFVPSSGRQLATLRYLFESAPEFSFVAENGAIVESAGEVVFRHPIDQKAVDQLIDRVRALRSEGADVALMVCGSEMAYMESTESRHLAAAEPYYRHFTVVPDLNRVSTEVLKLAVYVGDAAAELTQQLRAQLGPAYRTVHSAPHWVDVMNIDTNKGHGLRQLMERRGLERSEVLAIGDFMNDVELLDAAGVACVVSNAHPDLFAHADYVIPSNDEHGVLQLLDRLLEVNSET